MYIFLFSQIITDYKAIKINSSYNLSNYIQLMIPRLTEKVVSVKRLSKFTGSHMNLYPLSYIFQYYPKSYAVLSSSSRNKQFKIIDFNLNNNILSLNFIKKRQSISCQQIRFRFSDQKKNASNNESVQKKQTNENNGIEIKGINQKNYQTLQNEDKGINSNTKTSFSSNIDSNSISNYNSNNSNTNYLQNDRLNQIKEYINNTSKMNNKQLQKLIQIINKNFSKIQSKLALTVWSGIILIFIYLLFDYIKNEYNTRKMKQKYFSLYLDEQFVKGQDHQVPNKQLEEQFYKIINQIEYSHKKNLKFIAGISGMGKTTTIKKIIRQLRKKQNYKNKIYYFTFAQKDSQKDKKLNKQYLQDKKVELLKLLKQIADNQDQKNSHDSQNQRNNIRPIVIVQDINRLETLQNKTGIFNIIDYMYCLHSRSLNNIKIFCISSSTLLLRQLKQDNSFNKGNICKYQLLQPLKQETRKQILKVITYRQLNYPYYKSLFENYKPEDIQKINKFICQKSGLLPKQADYILEQTFYDLKNMKKQGKIAVDLVINEIKSNLNKRTLKFSNNARDLMSKTKIYQQNKQLLYKSFQKISQLQLTKIQQSSCDNIAQEIQQNSKQYVLSQNDLHEVFDKFQKLDILTYCHPRSQFMKNVFQSVKEKLRMVIQIEKNRNKKSSI